MRSVVLLAALLAACTDSGTPRSFDGRWATELLIYDCATAGELTNHMISATFDIQGDQIEILDFVGTTSAGTIDVQRDGDTIVIAGDVPLGLAGTLVGVEAMLVRDRNSAAAADGSSVAGYSMDPAMMDCRLSMTLQRK